MKTIGRALSAQQRTGGLAALYLAAAYLLAMPFFLVVVDVAFAFGLLQIAWFVGIGVTMLRTGERSERLLVPAVDPA